MGAGVIPSTILSLIAAASLLFGSALPSLLRSRFLGNRLSLLIGFSAGLMLATALHELLPEAIESNPQATWGAGIGFLTLYIAERYTHFHACRHRDCDLEDEETHLDYPVGQEIAHQHEDGHEHCHHSHHDHGHGHHHSHPVGGHADTMALVGMSIHNFADGLTTAAAFHVSQTVGVVVVIAIVLHQMAAGLSLGAIMQRAGRNRRRMWLSTSASASFIVLGAFIYNFAVPVEPHVTGMVLGIAAGSFLYVAACDLLPEAHADDEGWGVMATTLLGYLFAIGATFVFGSHGHGH